jgi:hypothetical protein
LLWAAKVSCNVVLSEGLEAYRLIILFVAEDRGLLHSDDTSPGAHERYADYFSTARLRQLVTTHAGGRHTDLWDAHQIVTDALTAAAGNERKKSTATPLRIVRLTEN